MREGMTDEKEEHRDYRKNEEGWAVGAKRKIVTLDSVATRGFRVSEILKLLVGG